MKRSEADCIGDLAPIEIPGDLCVSQGLEDLVVRF